VETSKKEETTQLNKVVKFFLKKQKRLKKRGNTSTINIEKQLKNIRKSLTLFQF